MSKQLFFIVMALLVIYMCNSFAEQTPEADEILWIDGKLPDTSQTEDSWFWDEDIKQDNLASHTDVTIEGQHHHSFNTDAIVEVNKDSKIMQYIFFDPKNSPKGIMIRLIYDDDKKMSLYWEGEEEVFADTDDYITAWYMGVLPKQGEWVRLYIDFKELDITKAKIKGMDFITAGGRIWWGKTVIKGGRYAKEETQGQAEMAQQKSE